jgi:phage shock protein PspC (stress-responsive transcriptional regulator)
MIVLWILFFSILILFLVYLIILCICNNKPQYQELDSNV